MPRKLTDGQVLEMRTRAAAGETFTSLACAFGMNCTTAKAIIRGFTYRDVGGPVDHSPRQGGSRGRLTGDQVFEMRTRAATGEAFAALARAFDIRLSVAQAAIRGFTYKDAGGPVDHPPRRRGARSLPPDVRERVRALLIEGRSMRSVSRELGVSHSFVSRVAKEEVSEGSNRDGRVNGF